MGGSSQGSCEGSGLLEAWKDIWYAFTSLALIGLSTTRDLSKNSLAQKLSGSVDYNQTSYFWGKKLTFVTD